MTYEDELIIRNALARSFALEPVIRYQELLLTENDIDEALHRTIVYRLNQYLNWIDNRQRPEQTLSQRTLIEIRDSETLPRLYWFRHHALIQAVYQYLDEGPDRSDPTCSDDLSFISHLTGVSFGWM